MYLQNPEKLQIILTASVTTSQLTFVCSYHVVSENGMELPQVSINGSTNNTTAVDITPAAGSSKTIQVTNLTIYNSDTTSKTVIIRKNVSANNYVIVKVTIAPDETLEYSKETGWGLANQFGGSITGIASMNGLTGASQSINTGTTGTDFNVNSSGSTHQFNLPVASAANTGKLSSTDWSTFNSKQNAIAYTPEDVANKEDTTINNSTSKYPTVNLLKTGLDGKVTSNAAITGATKTKITYDSKGLVTAGADATTADIADSTDKRYITDAQQTVVNNTSGTNTGDENKTSIETKLGAAATANSGYLTSTDWNTFNGKQKSITSGTAAPTGGSDGDIYLQYT